MPQDPVLAAHGTDICRLTPQAIFMAAVSDCNTFDMGLAEECGYAFERHHVIAAQGHPVDLLERALKRSRRQERFPLRADRHKASVIHLYRDPEALEKALEIARERCKA